jgi:hypothetical protein
VEGVVEIYLEFFAPTVESLPPSDGVLDASKTWWISSERGSVMIRNPMVGNRFEKSKNSPGTETSHEY